MFSDVGMMPPEDHYYFTSCSEENRDMQDDIISKQPLLGCRITQMYPGVPITFMLTFSHMP